MLDGLKSTFRNSILDRVEPEAIERLRLRQVAPLQAGQQIIRPNEPVRRVLFLESGTVSLFVTFSDGSRLEAGLIGNRSMVGGSVFLSNRPNVHAAVVQTPGSGFACWVDDARREFGRGGLFQELVLESVSAELTQTMQVSACNVKHDVVQRLSRWLLLCSEEIAPCHIAITQEELGHALNISRPTVSMTMDALRQEGIVEYSRGRIQIVNAAALERRACECFRVMKAARGSRPSLAPDRALQMPSPSSSPGRELVTSLPLRREA